MCCRRRNRAPATVTLAKMAFDKYQQYQAQKQIQQQPRYIQGEPSSSFSNTRGGIDEVNNEVLDRAGIPPPSYESVVKKPKRAESVRAESVASSSGSSTVMFTPATTVLDPREERGEISDDESVEEWKEHGGTQFHGDWKSRKEMKKAYKAARKAEKWASKAKARGYVY